MSGRWAWRRHESRLLPHRKPTHATPAATLRRRPQAPHGRGSEAESRHCPRRSRVDVARLRRRGNAEPVDECDAVGRLHRRLGGRRARPPQYQRRLHRRRLERAVRCKLHRSSVLFTSLGRIVVRAVHAGRHVAQEHFAPFLDPTVTATRPYHLYRRPSPPEPPPTRWTPPQIVVSSLREGAPSPARRRRAWRNEARVRVRSAHVACSGKRVAQRPVCSESTHARYPRAAPTLTTRPTPRPQ